MRGPDRQEDYRAAAQELLAKSEEALRSDDMVQASEEAWGVVAQMLKAAAQSRGWQHGSHRQLSEAAGRPAAETSDQRILELFVAANGLHMNFYENWLSPEAVEVGVSQVRELLDRLQRAAGGSRGS